MKEQLRALVAKHCRTIAYEAEAIRLCLNCFDQSATTKQDMLAEAIQHAHKIKGSSGTLGFPDISAAAACLERHFRVLVASDDEVGLAERVQIEAYYAVLDGLVAAATPEHSTLYNYQRPGQQNQASA